MQSSEDNAQGSERRVSTGLPRRLSESARSDDDYDLNAFAVSDGFRPTQAQSTTTVTTPQPPPPSVDLPSPPSKGVSDADRPSSTSKPPRTHDSLTLRNDGSSSARRGDPTAALPSTSNGVPLMQPETPYQGPSGPSHPYQMYPQRTFSNATASTAPNVDRQSYDGPRGPTHPYTLYTQNTAIAEETAQQHIPVGFTSLGNSYQRQIGPDGEEAGDLIGPLGHLEELPPYTRYPEETYARRKSPEPVQDAPSSAMPAIPGAGGIGIATRDPEFSSTEDDLALPPSRPASQGEASQHEVNTAARGISEKPTMTKWQRRARKKMWGIVPYWAICLLVVGLVIMGIVMGAVIGTVLANNHGSSDPSGDEQYDVQPTPTARDIEPYSTLPVDLPALPTGFFALPPLDTSQAPKSCFSDTTQSQAWSCEMPFRVYSMDIGRVPNATNTSNYVLTLTAFNSTYAKYIWGTQPPDIPDPRPLTLVADSFEERRGPAWWLSISYDKTVIVPEESLRPSLSKRSGTFFEQATSIGEAKLEKKLLGAQEGDKPWICTWPDTTLEIFIYPSQNVTIPTPTPLPGGTQTVTIDYAGPTATPDPDNPVISYPKVVKFLERRWGDDSTSPPTCRQVQIIDDGHGTKDILDKNGHPVQVVIPENVQSLDDLLAQRARIRHGRDKHWGSGSIVSRQALELTDCGCLWWST